MDRFIARENIRHFQEMLLSDIGPAERARIHKLLVEEEDKLGKNLELLTDLEKHIAAAESRIQRQQSLVGAMRRNGHTGLAQAQAQTLLDGMLESRNLYMQYRRMVAKEIDRSRL